jgi:hypothetical protein
MTAVRPNPAHRGVPMLIAIVCGLFGLVACGGGGGGAPDSVLPASALGGITALPALAPDPAPAGIGLSYTMESVKAPDGSEASLVVANSLAPIIRNINLRGDFIGAGAHGSFLFDHASHASLAIEGALHGVNDTSLVVGSATVDGIAGPTTSAFTWTVHGGKSEFLSGVRDVFRSTADSVSNSAFVAGTICRTSDVLLVCGGYRWDNANSRLTVYPNFQPFNLNEGGTLMGFLQSDPSMPPVTTSVVTVALDGSETFLGDDTPNSAGGGTSPLFLADNGDAYVEAEPFTGTTLIRSGSTLLVGRGFVPPISGNVEIASATAFNAVSRAVGLDRSFSDPINEVVAVQAAFSFSPAEGSREIKVSGTATTPQPRGVNKDGIVVGFVPDADQKPLHAFVWTAATGGMLLDSLVTNLPSGVHLSSAEAIGDGGHIVAQSNQGLVLLTPQACAPTP